MSSRPSTPRPIAVDDIGKYGALVEAEELFEDLGQTIRLRDDDLHQAPLGGPDVQLVGEDLDRAGDRRQGVADLMGDPRRELPDGRELLVEARLALELLQGGQVLEEDQDSLFAVRVEQPPHRIPDDLPAAAVWILERYETW